MPRHQHEERIGRSISLAAAKRSCLDKHPYDSRSIARDAQAKNAKRYGWAPPEALPLHAVRPLAPHHHPGRA
jgi:hypothetical protein